MIPTKPTLESFPGYPAGQKVPMMTPEGRGTSGILVCGEALGESEERDGLPFRPYAEAGSVLERALYRAGIPRDSLTLTNLVWYRPPRNWLDGAPWETDAIRACRALNDELIARMKPRVILALGGLAMRELTGFSGEKQGILMTRGFQVPALTHRTPTLPDFDAMVAWDTAGQPLTPTGYVAHGKPIPVVGSLHPSFLRRGSKERQADAPRGKVEAAGGGTRGMALLGVLIRDLQLAQDIATQGPQEFHYDDYRLGATLDDWEQALMYIRTNPACVVSYDFETQDSLEAPDEAEMELHTVRHVTQVQVSLRPGHALVSPWTPEILPVLRGLLESPATKLDWNGRKFDRPILRDLGIRTDLGTWIDEMDHWHHAQPDLPRGLQFATSFFVPEVGPWKHLSGSAPLYYGALDVDMPQRIHQALHTTLTLTRHPLSGVSLEQGHEDQVVALAPVLDRMSGRGIPVDEDRRQALDKEFTATLAREKAEMQGMYPDTLKARHPKDGYVRDPKDTQGMVQETFTVQVKCSCDWAKPVRTKNPVRPPDCPACANTGKVISTRTRWAQVLEFLPGSWQQVLRYVKHRRHEDVNRLFNKRLLVPRGFDATWEEAKEWAEAHTTWVVPRDYKTGRETTAEPELRRLAAKTGDPLLPKVLVWREVDKARGTYVQGWAPGADGRVHSTFGFKPATPQLSSENPNAQNFPAHGDLAKIMKQMIRFPDARKIVKLDWKSFFIITGGFEARDPAFLRIGRVDMHSFLTLVGLLRQEDPEHAFAWSSAELKERLGWWRKDPRVYPAYARPGHPAGMTFGEIRDEIAKRVVFGWENGQGPRSLWNLWQETFKDIQEAAHCQAMLRGLFPQVDVWQKEVCLKADQDHQLITRFGHVRRFWDVFQRRPVQDSYQPRGDEQIWVSAAGQRWLLRSGDDHEAVIAYLPNANAYGMKRRVMVELMRRGWDEQYGLIMDIHDALVFGTEHVENLLADVKPLMEAPCTLLTDSLVAPEGLWCATEAEVGPSLGELEKV